MFYLEDFRRKKQFDFENRAFEPDPRKGKAFKWFAAWLIVIIGFAVLSIFIQPSYIPALGDFKLADYVLYITVAIYVIAGIGACLMCGLKGKKLIKQLAKGMLTLLPAVAMILIAGGVRYIIQAGT